MSKLYLKLAFSNIKKNLKIYGPFIVALTSSVMMFYNLSALANDNSLNYIKGGESLKIILNLGLYVLGLFSLIFIFYTNSFLIKNRIKEFGLYNVLGLDKKHICIVVFFENLFTLIIALISGTISGIVFSKLIKLILAKIISQNISFHVALTAKTFLTTIILFSFIFLLTYLNTVIKIYRHKTVELLKSSNMGEKEPKVNLFYFIFGILALACGYYLSLSIKEPINSIHIFLIAVIAVIFGTYGLFISVSIFVLKLLKRNKNFYYQSNNFISISSLIYRMKQNAVGLASICVLSTMVLVTVSTTLSLYAGVEKNITNFISTDFQISSKIKNQDEYQNHQKQILKTIKEFEVKDERQSLSYFNILEKNGENFKTKTNHNQDSVVMYVVPLKEFNEDYKQEYKLKDNEVLIYDDNNHISKNNFLINEKSYEIKDRIKKIKINSFANSIPNKIIMVVNDIFLFSNDLPNDKAKIYYNYNFNLADSTQDQEKLAEKISDALNLNEDVFSIDSKEIIRTNFYTIYGSLFFLGIFFGLLFTLATGIVIYYKQIQEGYEDKKRFHIMQQVGLEQSVIKKIINKQVLIIFFSPLVLASIHLAFYFNLMTNIMLLFGLTDKKLFVLCILTTIFIFIILYIIVYILTSRIYYRIVRFKKVS